jgi:hypothetical protein
LLYELVVLAMPARQKVMPDDHSEVVPLLPIPNRTVKRLCADDSAGSRVKVGHRQALTATKPQQKCWGFCFLWVSIYLYTLTERDRPIGLIALPPQDMAYAYVLAGDRIQPPASSSLA